MLLIRSLPRLLVIASATAALVGCSGLGFGRSDVEPGSQAAVVLDFQSRLLDLREYDEVFRALGELDGALATYSAEDPKRKHLLEMRAEALYDLYVLGLALERSEPIEANRIFAFLGETLGASLESEAYDETVLSGIESAWRDARLDRPDLVGIVARASIEAPGWQEALAHPSHGARARVVALAEAARILGAWQRTGAASASGVEDRLAEIAADVLGEAAPPCLDPSSLSSMPSPRRDSSNNGDQDSAEENPAVGDAADDAADTELGGEDNHSAPDTLGPACPTATWTERVEGAEVLAVPDNLRQASLLVAMSALSDRVRQDAEDSHRVSRAALDAAEIMRERLSTTAAPLLVPPGLLRTDRRLSPPRSFAELTDESLPFTLRSPKVRMLLVRTNEVRVALRPSVVLADDAGSTMLVGESMGYAFPGQSAVAFERPGVIAMDELENGRVPALVEAMVTLERGLDSVPWMPAEEARTESGGTVPVSVLVDGDTYFASLSPLLATLESLDYEPIVFHAVHEETGELSQVPLRYVESVDRYHLLRVRADGYSLQPYDPEDLAVPEVFARSEPGVLARLHHHIANGFADGTLDPAVPIAVRLEDPSVDYAIVVHLMDALVYERATEFQTDPELLRAPIRIEGSRPALLAPAGTFLIAD